MTLGELLVDAFDRIREGAAEAVSGLDPDALAYRPVPGANSIGWLVWHLTRVQDDHVAAVAGLDQVWTAQGWYERFALPLPAEDTGYGHGGEDVAQVRGFDADLLVGYLEATHAQTVEWVRAVSEDDLGVVVDERWDPPVTLGVRLVSIVNDDQQHVGQAAYVRGLLDQR